MSSDINDLLLVIKTCRMLVAGHSAFAQRLTARDGSIQSIRELGNFPSRG
jgi:hypothetical protein